MFGEADSQITNLVCWLLTLDTSTTNYSRRRLDRILAQDLPNSMLSQLARVVASLLARSPRTRDEIRRRTAHYRLRFGFTDPEPEDHLIAFNQRGLYDAYRKRMESSGRWAVLFSDTKEFIFGDGFLHNFAASADHMMPGKKCVVPLTPTIAVVYMLPMSYPSDPKLVTIKVDSDEVQFLNDALQAYANQFLFFRSQDPELIPAFTDGQHRQFKYHKHEWLEGFLDDLSQYNLWGPGRSPGRSKGQFLKSLHESEHFDELVDQWRKEDGE